GASAEPALGRFWAAAPTPPAARVLPLPSSKLLSVSPSASASLLLYEERWRTTIYSTKFKLRTLAPVTAAGPIYFNQVDNKRCVAVLFIGAARLAERHAPDGNPVTLYIPGNGLRLRLRQSAGVRAFIAKRLAYHRNYLTVRLHGLDRIVKD